MADVDATGQTFRYPIDTESRRHLIDVALINFVNLRKQFNTLESALEELHRLNVYLMEEYTQGTFTKSLARHKVFKIATVLPRRTDWSEDSFSSVKTKIKVDFGISGRELSDSIKIIETHFEFAPLIGIEPPLLGVTEKSIDLFLNQWIRLNEKQAGSEPVVVKFSADGFDSLVKDMKAREKAKAEIWDTLSDALTPEVLAGLTALFYFGRDLDFSERYVSIYGYQLKDAALAFAEGPIAVKSELFHILLKTSYMHNLLRSLYFLKKNAYADSLVAQYHLADKFDWLEEARSGLLFEKPKYCGYAI